MRSNFIIRLHRGAGWFSEVTELTISGITILRKDHKYQMPFIVKGNTEKFGFSAKVKGKMFKGGGTHNYPDINFKGEYLDIEVKNFPRYPALMQNSIAAKHIINDVYSGDDNGFPTWTKYRKIEFLPLN